MTDGLLRKKRTNDDAPFMKIAGNQFVHTQRSALEEGRLAADEIMREIRLERTKKRSNKRILQPQA